MIYNYKAINHDKSVAQKKKQKQTKKKYTTQNKQTKTSNWGHGSWKLLIFTSGFWF